MPMSYFQEIPENFYVPGAAKVSQNLSMITWRYYEVVPTPLRRNPTYSQVTLPSTEQIYTSEAKN